MRRAPDISMQSTTGGARAKDAEKVDIPTWPKPSHYRSWRLNVVEQAVAASTVPDQAFSWMLEVDADGVTFEKQASSAAFNQAGSHFDFGTLYAKLGSTLTKASPSPFLNTVQARRHAAMREGRRLLGRQIMYLIDRRF